MLSDDEFLQNVLPHLRAKRAAQSRSSDSLHDSPSQLSSPKNDPTGHDRSRLWFPANVTQLSKYGKPVTVEVRAYAEPLRAALDSDVDGWINLNERVMNGQREKVALVSLRSQDITAAVDGVGVKIGERRALELIGLEQHPQRRYFVRMKVMNGDSDRYRKNSLWQEWLNRKEARGNAANAWISADKLRDAFSDSDDAESFRKKFIEAMEAEGRGEELAKHLKAEEMSKRLFGESRKL